jgi:pimeloyl-ACP methyl ester carboxylesterase
MPYTKNGSVRIYWEEEGEGEPLLALMGLSFSLAMWGALRPFLVSRFRTIFVDNRCVGRSDSPVPPFSLSDMAQDAVCVLDAAGVPSAHVFGMSMGGMIGQQMAIDFPDRIRKLVLGCTHCNGAEAVWAQSQFLQLLRFPFLSHNARIEALLPYIYHPNTPRERIDVDVALLRQHFPTLVNASKQMAAVARWRLCDGLSRAKLPTLVIHGDSDRLIPAAAGRLVSQRIPRSQFVMIPRASHIFPTDQPEATKRELLGFLAGD